MSCPEATLKGASAGTAEPEEPKNFCPRRRSGGQDLAVEHVESSVKYIRAFFLLNVPPVYPHGSTEAAKNGAAARRDRQGSA
jgi:hypothetical protein